MRKLSIYLIGLTFLSCVFSCTRIEELEDNNNVPPCEEKIAMTFSAVIDDGADTKTVLDGELGEDRRKVLWLPSDTIGVVTAGKDNPIEKFYNTITETSETGTFDGDITYSSSYHAIYPYGRTFVAYSSDADGASSFRFDFPRVQKYVPGTFATDSAPMVGKTTEDGTLKFKNLCGLLALKLKGEDTIESITFTAKDSEGEQLYVSGPFIVDMNYEDAPEVVPAALIADGITTYKYITLVCEVPVTLSPDQPTPFYIMLPPGTYDSFNLMITTSDGKMMLRTGRSLTINRAHVRPTSALEYAETISVDLSEIGTSNCYIVPSSGIYSFDASVIGNGEFGFINTMLYHDAQSEKIDPVSAEMLWEDRDGVIQGVSLSDGKISFIATGIEGNALIAAKDIDGNIIWSWHIWATDLPVDQTYVNSAGTFEVQDRNLGATRADRGTGDEWHESCGLEYNWGRKDPFAGGYFTTQSSTDKSISISSPALQISWGSSSWPRAWKGDAKTVYDPCPVGYRVAPSTIWTDFFITNVSGDYDHGWYFKYNDAGDTAWYPVKSRGDQWGTTYWNDCYMWSSSLYDDWQLRPFYISSSSVAYSSSRTTEPHQVRCVKDNETVSVILDNPILTDISSTTVQIQAEVRTYKSDARRGFIFGTSEDLTLDNAILVEAGEGAGIFQSELSGLLPLTKYYVMAFVSTENETIYSDKLSFRTIGPDEDVNLSAEGTSNCYVVYPVSATYTFDLVKGNSSEPISNAESVHVLWETYNALSIISEGDVIEFVELDNDKIRFNVSDDIPFGNALIAVKDASGRILWSWHIWVVDMDLNTSAVLYPSGAIMMDRNLGAFELSLGDPLSFGMFYQWGRKDPFVGYGGTESGIDIFGVTTAGEKQYVDKSDDTNQLSYAIEHPTEVISSSDWNSDSHLWNSVKTIYDPCPTGWRVADSYVWDGMDSPANYYPKAGFTAGTNKLHGVHDSYHIWSCDFDNGSATEFKGSLTSSSVYCEYNVRCMKDADIIPEMIEVSDIKAESARFLGKLTVNDNTTIDDMGFIVSKTNSDINLGSTSCTRYIVDRTIGEFFIDCTGLEPNTIYYVCAYVKGGHNIKYSDLIEFRTHSIGINDDFTDDDYEWE